jgi:uncharacterized protein (TIGR02284 family)
MSVTTLDQLNQDTITGLKDLIRINHDSHEGYRSAADTVDIEAMAELFRQIANQRQAFAQELKAAVELNDEVAPASGSAIGQAHRWWLKARGALTSQNAYAVLAEAERGEDAIKEQYEKVIQSTTGNPLNDVLHRQLQVVKKQHDAIRRMRDAHK